MRRGKIAFVAIVLCLAAAAALTGQTYKVLYSFCTEAGCPDGSELHGPLVQATNGGLYGTGQGGGTYESGTVFRITTSGKATTVYNFCVESNCADGSWPISGVIQGSDGNFYGTTYYGGTPNYGTVFKMSATGTLTTLHTFCTVSGCPDGEYPASALVQGSDGNLYGTTPMGGGAFAQGTVFKATRGGKFKTLYAFCPGGWTTSCTDGAEPSAGLIQATDGNFYGTTYGGGNYNGGTVFKITPNGALTTLYSFPADSDPNAGLVQGNDGNLYGTTTYGGPYTGGTVFEITLNGALTTLYSFCSQPECADGLDPYATLIQGTDGNLYGTTTGGGAGGGGTVFMITLSGTLTTLHSFCGQTRCSDGYDPSTGLVQDTNGAFYGVTFSGGPYTGGIVYWLSMRLRPFVKTLPVAAEVGSAVKILGTDLTGATAVTFNGTPAAFTVVSPTLITTTVPTGATTGTVQVVTPSGALLSNVPFRVLP